jgi:hypothetical protein
MREADQIDSFFVGLGAGVVFTVMVIITFAKLFG